MATIDYIVTTTGTLSPVFLNDLGRLELIHPSTVNLTDIFDSSILADSQDLQNAITNGRLVLTDNSGNQINQVDDLQTSVFSKSQVSTINSLVKYSSIDGKTVEQTNLISDATGLNLTSGKYKINGIPLRVESLDNVILTSPQNGDTLEYNSTTNTWFNSQRKLSFQWGGTIPSNDSKTGDFYENFFGGKTSIQPYVVPYNCFLNAITLSGELINEPYTVEILVNGTVLVSYSRNSGSLNTAITGLFIQFSQGSSVSFRHVKLGSIKARRPYINLYFRQL